MDSIERAFIRIPRANFLPEDVRGSAQLDRALPIGFGQTNSQPSTVEQMLRWLEPEPENTVLDVGSGSGWTTALLAYLVGGSGVVYAVEKVPELVEFGRQNCERLHIQNATFFEAGNDFGLPAYEPYDRILVSASAPELPRTLLSQLKPGGKLVIPVRHEILEITKFSDDEFDTIAHPGFIFVPLV